MMDHCIFIDKHHGTIVNSVGWPIKDPLPEGMLGKDICHVPTHYLYA